MPELPEVETIRIGLSQYLVDETVKAVDFDTPKSFPNNTTQVKQFLIGATITRVTRRAKVLIIDLDTDYSLVIHLKMTGQLIFQSHTERWGGGHPTDSLIGQLPDRSTRVIFTFADRSKLFFNDQRKFGWVRLIPTIEVPNIDFFKKIGPEPLGPEFTFEGLKTRLKRRPKSGIKAAILDQSVVAGIGNIYADELLHLAKIHPATLVSQLSTAKLKRLWQAIPVVLRLAIKNGGSTDRNYVNADGKKGNYLNFARVFRREDLPCPDCGAIIQKTRVAGRGTHFCPHCQPKPRIKK